MNSKLSKTCLILFLILFSFPVLPCRAVSFSADLVQSEDGKTSSSKFFLKDHSYRMDLVEDGQAISILVDRKTGKTRIVIPSEKCFLEIANDSMKSLVRNPFEAYQYMLVKQQVRSAGQETLEGISCEKQIISIQGKDVITAWVAKEYSFPMKIINQVDQKTVELKNIREKPLSRDVFAVSASYKLVSHMPVPAPAWAADIPSAPLMEPPFSRNVSEKKIIRIKPVKGFYLKLKLSNFGDQPGRVIAVAFKDGRPLRKLSYRTYNMSTSPGASVNMTEKAQPGQADVIVIRAVKGTIKVRAGLEQMPPEGAELKTLRLKAHQGRKIELDFRKPARLVLQDDAAEGKSAVTSPDRTLPQAERPKMIFILDASGSMWGQINGRSKIEIARK